MWDVMLGGLSRTVFFMISAAPFYGRRSFIGAQAYTDGREVPWHRNGNRISEKERLWKMGFGAPGFSSQVVCICMSA